MIKIFNKTKRDQLEEEEKKKSEEDKVGGEEPPKVKKSPGEIRLKKEINELDLPAHAQVVFPDENNIMKFEVYVDLSKEECMWKGAKYKFTVTVSRNYPHEAPKCHCET